MAYAACVSHITTDICFVDRKLRGGVLWAVQPVTIALSLNLDSVGGYL